MSHLRNLSHRRFGRLTVLRRGTRHAKNVYWLCLCACGKRKQIRNDLLQNGHVVSCGCYHREASSTRHMAHGHTAASLGRRSTPEYRAYHMQRSACLNPNSKDAPWYFDRGIEFRFSSFTEFLADVGLRPDDDYWLMRIDHDGHVAPGNLHWVKINRHHKRRRKHQPSRTPA